MLLVEILKEDEWVEKVIPIFSKRTLFLVSSSFAKNNQGWSKLQYFRTKLLICLCQYKCIIHPGLFSTLIHCFCFLKIYQFVVVIKELLCTFVLGLCHLWWHVRMFIKQSRRGQNPQTSTFFPELPFNSFRNVIFHGFWPYCRSCL